MSKVRQHIDIILILIVGFMLRFTISFTHSYSNDELSAVSRLRYENFNDLILFGVQEGDMHPAGVQVFMKGWSLIFGKSELAMRFPFVIFGTLSVFVLFLIGKRWFNRRTGLVAAGLLAVLYFPVMNSEFARPYSPGLLISLLAGLYLHKVLFDPDNRLKNSILLGLLFAGGMYTHYFAFLFVGFMGFTGLFFLNRTTWKYLLISGALGITLFLPHIGVTLYHLDAGGLQWLAPPSGTWLFEFIFHAFNTSRVIIGVLLVALVYGIWWGKPQQVVDKKNLIFPVIWFFGIFVVGFILSYSSTPILKFPVMLFAFPYFLLLIGGLLARLPKFKIILLLIIGTCVFSTLVEKKLYGNYHYALFKEPGIKMAEWKAEFGKENVYTIYNLNNPEYINFYKEEWGGEPLAFDQTIIEYDGHNALYKTLTSQPEEYCIIGFSSRNTVVQAFETVRAFYPEIVDYAQYNNGAVFLMKKGAERSGLGEEISMARFNSYTATGEWQFGEAQVLDHSESDKGYALDAAQPYGPAFVFRKGDLPFIENAYLKVTVKARLGKEAKLLATCTGEREGEMIRHRGENMWLGQDLQDMILNSGEGFFAFKIPSYIDADDLLKVSLWNAGGTKVSVDHFSVSYIENYWN